MNDNQYWDQDVGVEEETIRRTTDAPGSFIRVNGANISVEPGADAVESIKSEARNAGLGKFRVILNGTEIDPAAAPETLDAGMSLEIKPYEVAG